MMIRLHHIPLLLILHVLSPSLVFAQQNPMPDVSGGWRFNVTPYIWAVGVNGTVNTNDGISKSTNLSPSGVISDLKGGIMIASEAHKGDWGLGLDLLNANLGSQPGKTATGTLPNGIAVNADLSTKANLKDTAITAAGMYTLLNNQSLYMDGLIGARYISTTVTINANLNLTGTLNGQYVGGKNIVRNPSMTTNTTDPIIGLKGRYRIADSAWYVPYYADIGSGGGTTNLTWQAMLGVGRAYSWGDLTLGYRVLYYDMNSTGSLQKITFQGVNLGATFHF
ncbi:hypothetical protein [Polynucleobacter sp. AP-RePozz3-80-G7]|uniref:hypothetical protein n=1 Tax=Polynucleobacter sp. AP-RePozz3-80-G7 TaxID=2689105 RepID=UPI001C0E4456|nr:hypothetical protein [Polynucleobacter sp. AP-RePozz3-80-G7]MBU3638750.1 hypothetical protein [Polynucleobacter sp. AP-RePozz3-80-G7]